MRIGLLGGLRVEHDGRPVAVTGAMQLAVLFRLAVDAGTAVSYRAIAEDVWADAPENERAALQSIVSRLRSQLPAGSIESTAGGYRLAVAREDVDALAFVDLVARALLAEGSERSYLASAALALWAGEPWIPSPDFDWFESDLRRDRATALELGGLAATRPRVSSIPLPLTDLIGRAGELDAIAEQLAASRLVTIIGVGGAGKTRLAVETAAGIPGSVLVELAPVGPGELVAAILAATGRELRTGDGSGLTGSRERLLEALAGRQALLVLDNCEHIVDEVAVAAEWLLGALPQLRILATSREPLTIPGEAFVSVGPLPHPTETGIASATPQELRSFDAVELFAQRALAARGRALDDDELIVAARICVRLDGLPLALELAAAKLRTMTPAEVLAGLEDRFALLTGGFRTALPRHRTLRAMVDWSWSLLTDEERRALAWFAVFPAGVAAEDAGRIAAAMAVTAADFDSLVDRSLLQRSRGRYRALETIREYGVERLAERDELAAARAVQARFMADQAARYDREIRGPGVLNAISWFDAEEDNIAAALRYTTQAPLAEVAVRLAISCGWYWIIRGREEESGTWFAAVSPLAKDLDLDEARVISVLAPVIEMFSAGPPDADFDQEQIGGLLTSMLESLPDIGRGGHEVLQLLKPAIAALASVGGDPGSWMLEVEAPIGEDLDIDAWPTALLHVVRAAQAQNRGDVAELGTESAVAIERFEGIGDIWALALSQQMRAEWLMLTGELDAAFTITEQSTKNFRRITPSWDLAQQQGLAINIMLRQGRFDEVRVRVREILLEAEQSGNVRTQLQSAVTALNAFVCLGELQPAIEQLAIVDTLAASWPRFPGQIAALAETARAGVELLRDDLEAAENAMRRAVDHAIGAHDLPIIGMAALGLGQLALARGDVAEAIRAVDLATAIIGIHDSTEPRVAAIERAAAEVGLERTGAEAPTRSMALELLPQILRR
ncbi:MAG: ATPase [Actinomycetota bacterium]